jgi:hypothetical protein
MITVQISLISMERKSMRGSQKKEKDKSGEKIYMAL